MRDELRRQARFSRGTLEIFLVGAAGNELVLAALEQVPVGCGAAPGELRIELREPELARGT